MRDYNGEKQLTYFQNIISISEDALLKNYYRYRENLRQRKKRRERREKLKAVNYIGKK